MDKNYLIKLTQSLYTLTLLFPKKEPLRYKMREISDEILADFISFSQPFSQKKKNSHPCQNSTMARNLQQSLDVLDSFFEVAKSQNWVSPSDILIIQEEYNRIKAEIKKIVSQPPEKEKVKPPQVKKISREVEQMYVPRDAVDVRAQKSQLSSHLLERQKKILAFLKENVQAQVWQIKQILPQVSKRTLRRDFNFLLKQNKIERIGKRNKTFYQIKES